MRLLHILFEHKIIPPVVVFETTAIKPPRTSLHPANLEFGILGQASCTLEDALWEMFLCGL